MHPVSLRALSIGYLAAQRLTATPDGMLQIHSAFRHTLNVQLKDGHLLPLICAHSSLNHPDAVRVAVAQRWDWRNASEVQWAQHRLRCREWYIELTAAPVWMPSQRPDSPLCSLEQMQSFLEEQLRLWCEQQRVDSVLRLLPNDALGIPVDISPDHTEMQLAEMADRTIGFGSGLTPDGDDYLLGYLAALKTIQHPLIAKHQQQLVSVIAPRLTRTNDISRHYLQRALDGHFSQALCQLMDQLLRPFCAETLRKNAMTVMAFGAASGADCMAGFLHGLRNQRFLRL